VLHVIDQLPTPGTILDVGCGDGLLAAQLASRWPSSRVLGIDIDSNALALAAAMASEHPNFEVRRAALSGTDVPERFDMVICTDVLEHVEDDKRAFEWLAEHVAEYGSLIVHVPATPQRHLIPSINKALALEVARGVGPHLREGYSSEEARKLISSTGLRVEHWGWTFHHPIVRLVEDVDTWLFRRRLRFFKIALLPTLLSASKLERRPSTRRAGYGLLLHARRVSS
jgi:2-polyprenyl-3-methyl-5-hydroxy-6-metoxy-1,4-benzoquinol methylase